MSLPAACAGAVILQRGCPVLLAGEEIRLNLLDPHLDGPKFTA